ncbi:hypothetical protein, partial [Microbacterium testaceum]|uniref:hypothetical protein n=1 Tax=Microbacterium testaceum TaxID=2033 RepID=UPI0019D3CF53
PDANPKGLDFDPKELLAIRKNGPTRNKLAFDKCTLLSSQGTDAPTETISRPTREAVHFYMRHMRPSTRQKTLLEEDLVSMTGAEWQDPNCRPESRNSQV